VISKIRAVYIDAEKIVEDFGVSYMLQLNFYI